MPWVTFVTYNAPHLPLHTPPPGIYTEDLAGPDSAVHLDALVRQMVALLTSV